MAYDERAQGFRQAAQVAAAAVATIAAVVLLGGWVAGADALRTFGGSIPTKANAALSLLLCGVALFLLADRSGRGRRVARVLGGVAGAIGLVTVLEYATGRGLGIDELVFEDPTRTLVFRDSAHAVMAPQGRMAPQTAVAFVLTAAALIAPDWRPRGLWPAGIVTAIVAAISTTTLLGHVYGIESLYLVRTFNAMSAPTAAAFLLLAIGISCARPDRGVVAALTADTPGGMLLRFLVPPALVVPVIVGTLVMFGERHGFYGDGEGISLLVVATIFGCVTFAVAATRTLQTIDAERRRSDSRLLDQTRRFQTLVERLPLITYTDALDAHNTSIYVSPQVEATLGYTPDEWVAEATRFERLVHPEDRERVMSGIARFRETGEPFRSEYRLRARNGEYVWVYDETVKVMDRSRGTLYAQGYMLDITARKAAEEESRLLEAQLGEAQKLESIGRIAGGLAHDFSNMLGAVIAYAGFAEEKAQGHPELLEDVSQIRRAAERGAELTQELLVFGRKDVVRPRVIDLNEAVADTKVLLRPLLGDRHELRADLGRVPCVEADPAQVQRILMNLVMNAHAAMPAGGVVEVRSARVVLGSGDAPLGVAPGEHVALTVSDSGSGMDAEVARRAFEPFFTTKPKGEGTGLGLAIVYGIAKRLHGHVEIESAPGRGTTVTLLLPAVDAEPAAPALERAPTGDPGHGELVLVVDDDEALRRSTARILASNGYQVLEACDGDDGLAAYRDVQPRPAVVVTDVVMPGMTGPELADAVQAEDPGARVVFMSGYPEGLGDAREDVPLVGKPFKAEVLLTAVSEALAAEPAAR